MVTVQRVPAEDVIRPGLVEDVVSLVNQAYATAEGGLWLEGAVRTNLADMHRWIEHGEVVVAYEAGNLVGAVRSVHRDNGSSWFGALAVDPTVGGRGVGRTLVKHVEQDAITLGYEVMELEVLTATGGHPHLDALRAWYERLGYTETSRRNLAEVSPDEAPYMAVAIEAVVMEKTLQPLTYSLTK